MGIVFQRARAPIGQLTGQLASVACHLAGAVIIAATCWCLVRSTRAIEKGARRLRQITSKDHIDDAIARRLNSRFSAQRRSQ